MKKTAESVIHDLSWSLRLIMIQKYVNGQPGPTFSVPCHIDGDVFDFRFVKGREKAIKQIEKTIAAVSKGVVDGKTLFSPYY